LDDEIKDLMEYIENSSFVEFELERAGFKIKLVKGAPPAPAGAVGSAAAAPPPPAAVPAPAPGLEAARAAALEAAGVHVVKSPIVGTFYRSSGPGQRAFVEPGDTVKKGQILCIVEAMKLMNEIESDSDGEVLEVLVANGQPVEYGEPLFRIRKP
jgi:acetyl-CoA carboxylase biotin carboxyl carrier protein